MLYIAATESNQEFWKRHANFLQHEVWSGGEYILWTNYIANLYFDIDDTDFSWTGEEKYHVVKEMVREFDENNGLLSDIIFVAAKFSEDGRIPITDMAMTAQMAISVILGRVIDPTRPEETSAEREIREKTERLKFWSHSDVVVPEIKFNHDALFKTLAEQMNISLDSENFQQFMDNFKKEIVSTSVRPFANKIKVSKPLIITGQLREDVTTDLDRYFRDNVTRWREDVNQLWSYQETNDIFTDKLSVFLTVGASIRFNFRDAQKFRDFLKENYEDILEKFPIQNTSNSEMVQKLTDDKSEDPMNNVAEYRAKNPLLYATLMISFTEPSSEIWKRYAAFVSENTVMIGEHYMILDIIAQFLSMRQEPLWSWTAGEKLTLNESLKNAYKKGKTDKLYLLFKKAAELTHIFGKEREIPARIMALAISFAIFDSF